MTLINITRTANAALNLNQLENKCHQLYLQANQSTKQLGDLSGMYQVRKTLERIMDDIEKEYRVLDQMNQCLENICKSYCRHEEEIVEFAEEVKAQRIDEPQIGIVRVPDGLFNLLY